VVPPYECKQCKRQFWSLTAMIDPWGETCNSCGKEAPSQQEQPIEPKQEDPLAKFNKRVEEEVDFLEEYMLGYVFAAWGFSPGMDRRVWDLIHVSGYRIWPKKENGVWTAKVELTNDGKFDLAQAQEAVDKIRSELRFGSWYRLKFKLN